MDEGRKLTDKRMRVWYTQAKWLLPITRNRRVGLPFVLPSGSVSNRQSPTSCELECLADSSFFNAAFCVT